MKLIDRTMVTLRPGARIPYGPAARTQWNCVNLARQAEEDLLGHISLYKKTNGNYYYVYFVEARYFGMKEVELNTDKIIKEDRTNDEYHYSLDIFFSDKTRYLGWDKMFGEDFMNDSYEPILRAKV